MFRTQSRDGEKAQFGRVLASRGLKSWVWSLQPHKPNMVVLTCDPSTRKIKAEVRNLRSSSAIKQVEASLGYMLPVYKKLK